MTPAPIPDPTSIRNISLYAEKHNYTLVELTAQTGFSEELAPLLWITLLKAQKRGCIEFTIHSIRDKYDIFHDTHIWHVKIFGFLKTDGGKVL
jgi:hypothetical protein